ncbi:MAG: prepilin peptidase [Syntrophomonas sp.]
MMNYFLVAIFSLVIGSFLNVMIIRLPRHESIIVPRSHCPQCGQPLRATDLIPLLSYIVLRGKCRYCRESIKLQYPLIEALTMILFILIYNKCGLTLDLTAGCIFTALLLIASFTDLNEGIIPDRLTYPGIISGFILAWFSIGLANAILGAVVFGGMLFIISTLFHGGMGGGDIKLAAMIGAFTGWQEVFMVFVLSSILAAIWVLPLCLQGKANRQTQIKFGPFLAVTAWLVWMYGTEILRSYWQLLS